MKLDYIKNINLTNSYHSLILIGSIIYFFITLFLYFGYKNKLKKKIHKILNKIYSFFCLLLYVVALVLGVVGIYVLCFVLIDLVYHLFVLISMDCIFQLLLICLVLLFSIKFFRFIRKLFNNSNLLCIGINFSVVLYVLLFCFVYLRNTVIFYDYVDCITLKDGDVYRLVYVAMSIIFGIINIIKELRV